MSDFVIVSARRTPQGRFLGALAGQSAVDLACSAGAAALEPVGADKIDLVIVGNILSAGQGMNIARQIGVTLGVPIASPAFTVNMMCASGMKAIALGVDGIRSGEADAVLCGGTESMSNAPYVLERARAGLKLGHATMVDTILRDGLVDSFDGRHMGLTAERLAREYNIVREEQDAFALTSQKRYTDAFAANRFEREIVATNGLIADEHPRPQATLDDLAKLKPAFDRQGTVTPGNASGINDGAAMVVLARADVAERHGWSPLARVEGVASMGCDPARMGLGPVHAVRKLCSEGNVQINDFDLIELNEAFAAQALACMKELQLDPAKVNTAGGAIALGHPIGASGARLIVHLAHRLAAGDARHTLATLCVGGGMGTAMSLSAV